MTSLMTCARELISSKPNDISSEKFRILRANQHALGATGATTLRSCYAANNTRALCVITLAH